MSTENSLMPHLERSSGAQLESGAQHILVVDDNVADVKLLIEVLRREGYRITLAYDGERAYNRALALRPDLIVMDVCMPGMDGIVAGRLLKSDPATASIPIIYLTSMSDPETKLEALGPLGVDYVTKPFIPDEIVARIRIHTYQRSGQIDQDRAVMRSSEEVLVGACCDFLRTNLRIDMTAEVLSDKFNVTVRVLNHAFRKTTGVTASQYIKDARMKEVKRLLSTTSLPIADIAEEFGYSSNANFSTSFRTYTGMSPSAFRWGGEKTSHSADRNV
ncbi:MAG: response regulator [Achromobacter sp.]|uniref:response regulator transcription factor n=1 Tax=Achromobacter sp. TaxID=134375 RepID=UPI003D02C148